MRFLSCRGALTLLFILSSTLSAYAQVRDYGQLIGYQNMVEINEPALKHFGRGIMNAKNGDVVSIACDHLERTKKSVLPNYDCNAFRFILWEKASQKFYQFSVTLLPVQQYYDHGLRMSIGYDAESRTLNENQVKMAVERNISNWIGSGFGIFIEKKLKRAWTRAVLDQKGWNWSNNPVIISDEEFDDFIGQVRCHLTPSEFSYKHGALRNQNNYAACANIDCTYNF